MADPYGTVSFTPYKSMYVDQKLPEQAKIVRERYDKNLEDYDALNRALGSIETMPGDDAIKNKAKIDVEKRLSRLVESGAYEHAGRAVQDSVTDLASNSLLIQAMKNKETRGKELELQASMKAQGKMPLDFGKTLSRGSLGEVQYDEAGMPVYHDSADYFSTAESGEYTPMTEETLNYEGKAMSLMANIQASSGSLQQVVSSGKLSQADADAFLQYGTGIGRAKMERVARAVLPLFETSIEGAQLKRSLMQLSPNMTTGQLHSEGEADNVLLDYLVRAGEGQVSWQNQFVKKPAGGSGSSSGDPATNNLHTLAMDPVKEGFSEATGDFELDDDKIQWTMNKAAIANSFDENGTYSRPEIFPDSKSGTGKGWGGVTDFFKPEYDPKDVTKKLEEKGGDWSKMDMEWLDNNQAEFLGWVMEESDYAKPENRKEFTIKDETTGQIIRQMNDKEFFVAVQKLMVAKPQYTRLELQPGSQKVVANQLWGLIQSGSDKLKISSPGKDSKTIDSWIADKATTWSNNFATNSKFKEDMGVAFQNAMVDPGQRKPARNTGWFNAGHVPVAHISYNHTGPNAGTFHVSYEESKSGNKIEFEFQPFSNLNEGQGVVEQIELYDLWASKDLNKKKKVPINNLKSFLPNVPGVVDGSGELILSNTVADGELLPHMYIVQNGNMIGQSHGWDIPKRLGSYYEAILMGQNNFVGQALKANKTIRPNTFISP